VVLGQPFAADRVALPSPPSPVAADLLLGRERVRTAQVVKQADVLMLHLLVPEETVPGSLEPNLAFHGPAPPMAARCPRRCTPPCWLEPATPSKRWSCSG
jgi:hypothetical protein